MGPVRLLSAAALAFFAGLSATSPAMAIEGVVASIKPVHSLVAAVMKGVGEPDLILKGAASPHTYALRPSDAAALERAKLIFWIGPHMEAFLAKPLESLASDARVVELGSAKGVVTLPLREGGAFEEDEEGGEEAHAHGETDAHIWLDPENAKAMVREIEMSLAAADPANAAAYAANAGEVAGRLDAMSVEIQAQLNPVRGKGFVVFHDAYQYFEKRFGIEAAGSITVSPELMPGAARITAIRDKVATLDVACVFAEPQFEPRLIEVITQGTSAQSGVLDPEGSTLEPGSELYFTLLRGIAASLSQCLSAR